MAKPIENILIFPLRAKDGSNSTRVTSNSYIRFRDSYVEYETREIFINFSLKNFSKLRHSYLSIIFRYRQTSSNVVKHRQTSSNVVKRRQTSSNITLTRFFLRRRDAFSSNILKHRQTLHLRDSFSKKETLCRQTS